MTTNVVNMGSIYITISLKSFSPPSNFLLSCRHFAAAALNTQTHSVFMKWREDNTLRDLHPTSPAAYKSTKRTPYADLPAELRDHVFDKCHCADCKDGAKFVGDDWDARAMICGAEEEDDSFSPGVIEGVWDDFVHPSNSPPPPTSTAKLPITTDGMEVEIEGTSTESRHGVIRKLMTTVISEEIKTEHLSYLDPAEWLEDQYDPCEGR